VGKYEGITGPTSATLNISCYYFVPMKKYIIVILAFLFNCSTGDKRKELSSDSTNLKSAQTPSDDSVRLPKSDNEITEGGIGSLLLGISFDSVDKKFDKVDTLSIYSEGESWPAKRISLGNGEWILAESNFNNSLTRLHTNSTTFRTLSGLHIGQKFEDVLDSGQEIGVDIDEGYISIRLYGDKVSITIDSISLKSISKTFDVGIKDIPKEAKIVTMGIF